MSHIGGFLGFIGSLQHPRVWEVAVPSGIPVSKAVKREFFDLVCRGMATTDASVKVGVSRRTGWHWWHDAGGMKLRNGANGLGGLASAGDLSRPGGASRRLCFEERMEIMRARDAGLNCAQIAALIGRDRSVVWREIHRNSLPDGDYHALMANAFATENAAGPKISNCATTHCAPVSKPGWMTGGAPS